MCIGLFSAFTIASLGESLVSNSKGRMKCESLNKRPCQVKPTFVNITSNESLDYYPFIISINKLW